MKIKSNHSLKNQLSNVSSYSIQKKTIRSAVQINTNIDKDKRHYVAKKNIHHSKWVTPIKMSHKIQQ